MTYSDFLGKNSQKSFSQIYNFDFAGGTVYSLVFHLFFSSKSPKYTVDFRELPNINVPKWSSLIVQKILFLDNCWFDVRGLRAILGLDNF